MLIAPAQPGLRFAFRITAEIGATVTAGPGLDGQRLHIPILGGTIEGPGIAARILPGGSDWALLRKDGNTAISATYSAMTDDGVPILIRNDGLRRSPPEVLARMRAGQSVSPEDYYFRATPRFDVPDGKYQWLRESLFLSSGAPQFPLIVLDVHEVL